MTVTLNGKDVLLGSIVEPVTGVWSGDFQIDSDEALSGRVTLDLEGVAFLGTIERGELEEGRFHALIVGGNGQLKKKLPAKHYMRALTSLHLQELASAGGEKISKDTDPAVLSRVASRYSRRAATIGTSIGQIARECAVNWRMLRDGTIWLGKDSWPAPSIDSDELQRGAGIVRVSVEAPLIRPGIVFSGRKVVSVKTDIDATSIMQTVTFADDDSQPIDRTRQMLEGIVESLFGHRMDFGAWYPSKVVSQSADLGTVELYPDDAVIRGQGISEVPLLHGLPGCQVRLSPGCRVRLYFEDCDPSKPAAALWGDGQGVLEISVTAQTSLSLSAPIVHIDGNLAVSGNVSAVGNVAAANVSAAAAISGATVAAGPVTLAALAVHVHQVPPGVPSGPPIAPAP